MFGGVAGGVHDFNEPAGAAVALPLPLNQLGAASGAMGRNRGRVDVHFNSEIIDGIIEDGFATYRAFKTDYVKSKNEEYCEGYKQE